MSAPPAVPDLLALTAEIVDISSVSHNETAIADHVEALLAELAATSEGLLEVVRIGDNVGARTLSGQAQRLILAGHLDTVPENGNAKALVEHDTLYGLGSADMKGGVAVFLELAREAVSSPRARLAADLTFLFYVCEEVEQRYSGLPEIEAADPSWLEGDAAILGEPTSALVEAGCQGVLDVTVSLGGTRAHTARPWMGRNAIHRLAPVLSAVAGYEPRLSVIDGCEFKEALQAVKIDGGVANNVVPDAVQVVLNHRFAPDRTADEAFEAVRNLLAGAISEDSGDRITLDGSSAPALPRLSHPLLSALVASCGTAPAAKLGWTDVSFFSARGTPAANFGPGAPTVAHSANEHVTRSDLDRALETLRRVVFAG